MTLASIAVVTSEPDGTKPILKFFPNQESARQHAQMICNDLTRDAYVVEVTHKFLANRDSWAAEQKRNEDRAYYRNFVAPKRLDHR